MRSDSPKELLLRAHAGALSAYGRLQLHPDRADIESIEDIAVDSYLVLLRAIEEGRVIRDSGKYVSGIAFKRVLQAYEKWKRRREILANTSSDLQADSNEKASALKSESTPPYDWSALSQVELLLCRFFVLNDLVPSHTRSLDYASTCLGLTRDSIKMHWTRIRKKVGADIGPDDVTSIHNYPVVNLEDSQWSLLKISKDKSKADPDALQALANFFSQANDKLKKDSECHQRSG